MGYLMALKNTLLNDATHRHTNNFVTNAFSVMDFHDYKYLGFLSVFRLKTCQIFTLLCSVLSNLQGGRKIKKSIALNYMALLNTTKAQFLIKHGCAEAEVEAEVEMMNRNGI